MMNHWPQPFAFVVQFPADADPESGPFEGRVEHVISGRAIHFSTLEELRKFVAEILDGIRTADKNSSAGRQ